MPLHSLTAMVTPRQAICIADIGASYLSPPAYDGLLKRGHARLVGFEPNPAECDKLRRLFGAPHQFHQSFVGRGGSATYHETSTVYTGSLLKPNAVIGAAFTGLWESMTPVAEHAVQTVALDTVLAQETVDYIKIDVQGGELQVFEGARSTLKNVFVIHTEVEFVPLYENQPLFSDVDVYLRQQGFCLVKFIDMRSGSLRPCIYNNDVNRGGNQLLWSDALYVKDVIDLSWMDDDQLLRMAVVCHDVYQLGDFCFKILGEWDRRTGDCLASEYLSKC